MTVPCLETETGHPIFPQVERCQLENGSCDLSNRPAAEPDSGPTAMASGYAQWAAQFGAVGGNLSADFDGNENVGAGDYALWAARGGISAHSPGMDLSASESAGSDPADWLGGIAALDVNPPYVGSGIVDAQLGDGAYTSRDVDLFAFDVLSGTSIFFESFSQPGQPPTDTQFRLFNILGQEFAYDDDGGTEPGCSRLEINFSGGGRWYLGVSGYNNRYYDPNSPGTGVIGQTGPYRLSFTVAAPPDIGDRLELASIAGHELGGAFATTISAFGALGNLGANDVDLYTFEAFRGTLIDFETGSYSSYSADTYLRLFDNYGSELTFNDDGGEGTFSLIDDFYAPYTGRYYIGVSGYPNDLYNPIDGSNRSAGSIGDYLLEMTFTEYLDQGDTRSTAGAWSDFIVSEKLGNNPSSGGEDVDLLQVSGYAGDRLLVHTESTGVSGDLDVDTVLRIFDANGNQVAFNDDVGTSTYSQIDFTLPAAGIYYVGVSGYPNSTYDVHDPDITTNRLPGAIGDYLLVGNRIVESTPPALAITSPTDGSVVSELVPILGSVYDANLESWELRVGPTPGSQPTLIASGTTNQSGYLGSWYAPGSTPDGNYYLSLTASDQASNVATLTGWHLILDNTSPIALLTSPLEGATVSCQVPITGIADDAHFGSWALEYSSQATGPWTFLASGFGPVVNDTFVNWDTRAVSDGPAYLRLLVADQVDHLRQTIRGFVVNNGLTGDANGDCSVGAADYAVWAAQFGQSGSGLAADFDCSGSVGAGDYALWAANFGKTCPPSASPVLPSSAVALGPSRQGLWDRVMHSASRALNPLAVDRLMAATLERARFEPFAWADSRA